MSPWFTGLAVPTFLAASMVAGYTGFLFGQAEGRDLWQSPLLFWHLVVQAFAAGGGALLVAAPFAELGPRALPLLAAALTLGTAVHLVMLVFEYLGGHETRQAASAAHLVTHGRYATTFWAGGVALGAVAAVARRDRLGRRARRRHRRRRRSSRPRCCSTSRSSSAPARTSRSPDPSRQRPRPPRRSARPGTPLEAPRS